MYAHPSPKKRHEILQSEWGELERYLRKLTLEQLAHPSACSEWCVTDVVAHLAYFQNGHASRFQDALTGDSSDHSSVPAATPAGRGNEQRERNVAAFRERIGDDKIVAEWVRSMRALDEMFASLGPADWDRQIYRPGLQVWESIESHLDVNITETAVHGFDIRSRLDGDTTLSGAVVPIIVYRLPQRPFWLADIHRHLSTSPTQYRFLITDQGNHAVDILLADTVEQQFMEVGSNTVPDVSFRCDGETFVLLAYGRISTTEAQRGGRLTFEGDQDLVSTFAGRFVGG